MTQSEFDHFLSRVKALSPTQTRRLRSELEGEPAGRKSSSIRPSAKTTERTGAAASGKEPLTRDELNRRLLAAGLVTALPDPALDIDDDDPDDAPVPIKGESLSETILRERR